MMPKSNNGKRLEDLVALIEGRLAPSGYTVESRKREFDEHGIQTAEFDVVISGQLGTSRLSWLIQCRDRPSGGAAPVEWIEQLAGRRDRCEFDKVMAVSSTGFSPAAIEAGKKLNIDLRSLESLTLEQVASWLPLNAPLLIRDGQMNAVRVFVAASGKSDVKGQSIGGSEKVFVGQSTGDLFSLTELWQKTINNDDLWKDVRDGDLPVHKSVSALEFLDQQYKIRIENELLPLDRIEVDATFQKTVPKMPLIGAAAYSSGSREPNEKATFAVLGHWKLQGNGPVKEMMIIGFPKRTRTEGNDT